MLLNHTLHRHRECKRHGRQQSFRDERNNHTKRKDKALRDRIVHKKHCRKEEEHAGADRHRRHLPCDTIQLLLQRAFLFLERLSELRDLTKLGLHTGCNHNGLCRAAGDAGTRKHKVWYFRAPKPIAQDRIVGLSNRVGFPSQSRLVHLKIAALKKTRVSRNLVSFGKKHDVSGHEIFRKDAVFRSVSNHTRIGRQHVSECFRRLARAVFLPEAEYTIDDVNQPNGNCELHHVGKKRDNTANPQQDGHKTHEICQKDENDRFPLLFGDNVFAVNPASVLYLSGG